MKGLLAILCVLALANCMKISSQVGVTPQNIENWISAFMEGFGFSNYVTPAPNCSTGLVGVLDQTAAAVNLYMSKQYYNGSLNLTTGLGQFSSIMRTCEGPMDNITAGISVYKA